MRPQVLVVTWHGKIHSPSGAHAQWAGRNDLVYPHPFGSPDFYTQTEKRALKGPVPFTVTFVTEVFFHFTIFRFDINVIDQFYIISMTIWTSHGFSAFLIQSPLCERRNQCVAHQRTCHDFFNWNRPTTGRKDLTDKQ